MKLKKVLIIKVSIIITLGIFFVLFLWQIPDIRIKVIDMFINDQEKLVKIVIEDKDYRVRKAVVEKLKDQNALAKVALEDKDYRVRKAAVQKLTNQNALAQVALEEKNIDVYELAARKLTDQRILAQIALDDQYRRIRDDIVMNLSDQTALAQLALNEKDDKIRKVAIEKLTDQNTLAMLALNDNNDEIRKAAVKNLTDKASIAQILLEDKDVDIRYLALNRLMDQIKPSEQITNAENLKTNQNIEIAFKIVHACETLEKRFTEYVLNIIYALNKPEVKSEVGDLVLIYTVTRKLSQTYEEQFRSFDKTNIKGESFTIFAVYSKRSHVFCHTWSTKFPETTRRTYSIQAKVIIDDFINKVIDNQNDPYTLNDLQALRELNDQNLLTKIIELEENYYVREAAKKRLLKLQ